MSCTITFNEKELGLLLNALGKQPFEEVYELIEKIVTAVDAAKGLALSEKNKSLKQI